MIETIRKVLALFEPQEHWKLAGLACTMAVAGLLQTVGIASIMPFVGVVTNPDVVNRNPILAQVYEWFPFESTRQFSMVLGVVFVLLMTASNAFAVFTMWLTLRVVWRNHHKLSLRLLDGYLQQPYSFYLSRNSAKLAKTLLGQVKKVMDGVVVPCMEILARGLAAIFIVILLVLADPIAAVFISVILGGAYSLAYLLVRDTQKRLGAEQFGAKTAMYQIIYETFGGIKDVKVLGREAYFLERFRTPSLRYGELQAFHVLLGSAPRFALEFLAYGGIVAVVLYLLQTRETLDQVFPLLAVYGVAANKLMPSLQSIFTALTQVRFNAANLNDLHQDMIRAQRAPSIVSSRVLGAAPADVEDGLRPVRDIRMEGVSFRYPRAEASAVTDVSLVIPANQTVAFVGSSGSGKTTLADLLLGLLVPTQGEIFVDGIRLGPKNMSAWRRSVGYVPQNIFLADETIAKNIAFCIPDELIDAGAVQEAAHTAHLTHFVSRLPHGYDTPVGERGVRISGGQRQRIGIARALYHNPPVLILDEATSALDNPTENVVMRAIRDLARTRTIILIAHRLTTVQPCDRIYLIEDGRLISEGTYQELIASNPAFQAMART